MARAKGEEFFSLCSFLREGRLIQTNNVVILGAGYTGRSVQELLGTRGYSAIPTKRTTGDAIVFDLQSPQTWENVPSAWGAIWTFPAEPPEAVRTFSGLLFGRVARVVVIGTTSSYLVGREGGIVTAETPLDEMAPRVQGEEYLRRKGAVVLRSSGIYGPNRNPLDWIRRGLVRDMNKIVNLIHVGDLSASILAALERGTPGSSYTVTDGQPRVWREIAEWGIQHGYLTRLPDPGVSPGPSRRIDNTTLITELHPELTHLELFDELHRLEKSSQTHL
jgi:hypothetical protein